MAVCVSCEETQAVSNLEECDNCGDLVCDDCVVNTDWLLFCSNECEQE